MGNLFKRDQLEDGVQFYNMPEGVAAALLRLENACVHDGVDELRAHVYKGNVVAYINDERGITHRVFHRLKVWLERMW